MGFHVDYSALDDLYQGLYNHATSWNDSLRNLENSIQALIYSENMAGTGADNLKSYLNANHSSILSCLSQLIALHTKKCLLYVRDYQSNIDTGLHVVIDEDELETISDQLSQYARDTEYVDGQAQSALSSVSDLIYVPCYGNAEIQAQYRDIDSLIRNLKASINALEDEHYRKDFVETTRLINAVQSHIQACLRNDRTYKLDFSVSSLSGDAIFLELYDAYVAANSQSEVIEDAVNIASVEEAERMEKLQREKEANVEKWVFTGLCVVGSFVIIASFGTATPLVVGGVSAGAGILMAANNAMADEYIEHAWSANEWDWGTIAGEATIGGVTGFITGYIGAGVGHTVTTTLTKNVIGQALINSNSALIRVGSNAVIGSTSQVISGIASREVGTFAVSMITSNGDIDESIIAAQERAFNLHSIAFDGAFGAALGAWHGLKKYKPTNDLRKHLENPEPTTSGRDGIKGAHDKASFLEEANRIGAKTENPIPSSQIDGVEKIPYRMPKKNIAGEIIPGEYQNKTFYKTVYDPDRISIDSYMERGIEAANNSVRTSWSAKLGHEWTGVDNSGVSWHGYCDADGNITSFYPE